jgi:hypothetical protein
MRTLYLAALMPFALAACNEVIPVVPAFKPAVDPAISIRTQPGFPPAGTTPERPLAPPRGVV